MNNTERYLCQLRAQFEREGKRQRMLGFIWLSPRRRDEILRELLLPVSCPPPTSRGHRKQ